MPVETNDTATLARFQFMDFITLGGDPASVSEGTLKKKKKTVTPRP